MISRFHILGKPFCKDHATQIRNVTNSKIFPVLGEGRHEGAEGDGARVGKEARHFADAANVLVAVSRREAEIAAEAVVAADVVSVEAVAEYTLREGNS